VSGHALHGLPSEHGVTVLDVEGFPLQSQWHGVHPRGKQLSPIARVFLQMLLEPPRAADGAPQLEAAGALTAP
jgi:hypothetical protein